ncbi:LysR family transcriptional regulator [Motilimonas pumila]|uniref:LysR family transcriptional regulator n=1 Tax=Motilimonas pumila TaxID=2303987 RepID=A0A418YJP6_9GAMM|nr:LysR family transcriptional regulator [Motilimonas pumila]RJG51207.1 LysR family transcriptional regulator [Motilimonas pumila]
MLESVSLDNIRLFVLIAQQGNFTKVAERLGISRSHVSRQVSALESQLGMTLFVRTTRTLALTPAGENLFQDCQQALLAIDRALLTAVDDNQQVRGRLRVNCVGGYLGEELIAQHISQFMLQHPDIKVELAFSSHRIDLIADEFDVAFRMGALEDAGFIGKKLASIEMVTLASPAYLSRFGPVSEPKVLSHHRCLTGSVTRWHFVSRQAPQKAIDVVVPNTLSCKNGKVLVAAALAGNGIIRVPALYCQQEIEEGLLVPVFTEWQVPSVDFSMIYHKDKFQSQRLRSFIGFIKQHFVASI